MSLFRLLARTQHILPAQRFLLPETAASAFSSNKADFSKISARLLSASPYSTTAAAVDDSSAASQTSKIRNFAIIAHVDHGKTTLLDRLISECAEKDVGREERVMDHNSLEQERGITISSKYTSLRWGDLKLNAVDTPGHADFGGEVERVLSMVDGALLLVDALEGPLAQTKFVVAKALARGVRPILLLNKVDREAVTEERCEEVESELFDLFAALGADDEQLDFKTLYASAREGVCTSSFQKTRQLLADKAKGKMDSGESGMGELINAVIQNTPSPTGDPEAGFSMLVSMIERDVFLGRLCTGRVSSGRVRVGDKIKAMTCVGGGETKEVGKVTKIFTREGLTKIPIEEAVAGDIICLAGIPEATVTDTIASMEAEKPQDSNPIDPPTIKMSFGVNDSPLVGKEGTHVTGSKLLDRLLAEAESNVSINVVHENDSLEVHGRGELQLGVLIETMRREGYEMSVSPPRVLYRDDENGKKLEPIEEVLIELEEQHCGSVIEALSFRKGELVDMQPGAGEGNRTRLTFHCPSRGLIGYRGVLATMTSGSAILHRSFHQYDRFKGNMDKVRKGVLVSMASGPATGHALAALEPRGILFVDPATEIYPGMIIGENSKQGDMEVNPCKGKKLTNVRSKTADEQVKLSPPKRMTLEEAMGYVQEGEMIEVTPQSIRLRKTTLNSSERSREARAAKKG